MNFRKFKLIKNLFILFFALLYHSRYVPMAEMNFGPPQMSMTSGPHLTYGTIISATQLFTQAQWNSFISYNSSGGGFNLTSQKQLPKSGQDPSTSSSSSNKDKKIDSARREWERANPEDLRRVQAKDLRKILGSSSLGSSVLASASSTSKGSLTSFLTGHDLTVPLLSTPRLIKRPFDPLICENIILSKATALGPLPGRTSRSSPGAQARNADGKPRSPSRDGSIPGYDPSRDPWFDSMEEDNTRLALEVNLVLILCQALEGVRSPRLAVRDRQLIVRETATELSVFFDFLEHRGKQNDWTIAAALVDQDTKRTKYVYAPKEFDRKLPARLVDKTTVDKSVVIRNDRMMETIDEDAMELTCMEKETRTTNNIVTTGGFKVKIDTANFLQLLGKLLKSVVESLDSAQFG